MGLLAVFCLCMLHCIAKTRLVDARHNTALILFQSNELELLGDWLEYHARIFGWDSIYIIDQKSDVPVVTNWLQHAEVMGSHVNYFQGTFKEKKHVCHMYLRRLRDETWISVFTNHHRMKIVAKKLSVAKSACESSSTIRYRTQYVHADSDKHD